VTALPAAAVALACLAAFTAGLSSPDRALAVTVSWYRLRYSAGLAEAAAGAWMLAAAAFAAMAGGGACLLARAARSACEWADRAALSTIPQDA
jgi:hypothetical protein